MLALEVLDEHCGDEETVFHGYDSCPEQFDIQTGVSQNSDDELRVSCGSCFF